MKFLHRLLPIFILIIFLIDSFLLLGFMERG